MFKLKLTTKEQRTLDTQKGSGFLGRNITVGEMHPISNQAKNCNRTSEIFKNLIGLNMFKLISTSSTV